MWCSDSAQCGPLQRTIAALERSWRGATPAGTTWECLPGPVEGLYIVHDFLALEEVEALRALFHAHHGWTMYNWGNVGAASRLQPQPAP